MDCARCRALRPARARRRATTKMFEPILSLRMRTATDVQPNAAVRRRERESRR
jgi:hypothetical protein